MHSTQMPFRLWHDKTLSTPEVAERLGVPSRRLYKLADVHKLPRRERNTVHLEAPSDADELLSGESLAFSPWVASRIKELGLGVR